MASAARAGNPAVVVMSCGFYMACSAGMMIVNKMVLRSLPLPAKLAGGLLLFKTSVPAADKPFAGKLLVEAQQALRNDPRVTMELGAVSDRHSRTRASPLRSG